MKKILNEQPSMEDGVVVFWGPPDQYDGPNTSTAFPYFCQEKYFCPPEICGSLPSVENLIDFIFTAGLPLDTLFEDIYFEYQGPVPTPSGFGVDDVETCVSSNTEFNFNPSTGWLVVTYYRYYTMGFDMTAGEGFTPGSNINSIQMIFDALEDYGQDTSNINSWEDLDALFVSLTYTCPAGGAGCWSYCTCECNQPDGCSSEDVVSGEFIGCTDPEAYNYSGLANVPCTQENLEGSCAGPWPPQLVLNSEDEENCCCVYYNYGCTDSTAINYNPDANVDDDSCEYPEIITADCTDEGLLQHVNELFYNDPGLHNIPKFCDVCSMGGYPDDPYCDCCGRWDCIAGVADYQCVQLDTAFTGAYDSEQECQDAGCGPEKDKKCEKCCCKPKPQAGGVSYYDEVECLDNTMVSLATDHPTCQCPSGMVECSKNKPKPKSKPISIDKTFDRLRELAGLKK